MVRKNPITLTLINKEAITDDEGNTFYEYHYSYVGRGGETRYKTVKRRYFKKKTGRQIDADKMFASQEIASQNETPELDISEP